MPRPSVNSSFEIRQYVAARFMTTLRGRNRAGQGLVPAYLLQEVFLCTDPGPGQRDHPPSGEVGGACDVIGAELDHATQGYVGAGALGHAALGCSRQPR